MRTCEGCGNKMPFGTKRHRVDGKLVCDGCRNGRPGMPRSQVNRQGAKETDMNRVARGDRFNEYGQDKDQVGADLGVGEGVRSGWEWAAAHAPCPREYWPISDSRGDDFAVGFSDGVIQEWCPNHSREQCRATWPCVKAVQEIIDRTWDPMKSGTHFDQMDLGLTARRVANLVRTAEFPPKKKDDGGSKPPPPKASGMPGQPPSHPGMPPMPHPMDPMGMGMGMGMMPGQPQQPAQPATPFAPDQQSDMVVRVCPFCGSGHLTGQSDGSIKCGYDDTVFTVTVMPSHPFQPLVNPDGSPFKMPQDPDADPNPQVGQASPEGTPGEGPADPNAPTPPGQAPNNTPPLPPTPGAPDGAPGASAPGAPAGALDLAFEQVVAEAEGQALPVPQDQAAAQATVPPQGGDEAGDDGKDLPPWMKDKKKKSAMFITASGVALDEDAYVEYLRATVL